MPDVFANIKSVPVDQLEMIAKVLELRASIPSQREMLKDYLTEIRFPENAEVLEVGCGTGPICRALAQLPSVARVVGVEPCPVFVAKAREFAGGMTCIEFEEGDGNSLRFDDSTFDVVVLHTLLTHVPQPEIVLQEAYRVLRPGGSLGLCDGDFSTATTQTGSIDPLEACTQKFVEDYVNDKWIVRRMSALAEAAGFEVGPVRSYGLIETNSPELTMTWVDRGADALAVEGSIGTDLADALKAEARRRANAGTFYGYMAYGALTARKPH